jgi:hypothetical protein
MEKINLIYCGVTLSVGNKKRFAYCKITESELSEERLHFAKKLVGIEMIGTVVSIETDGKSFKGPKVNSEFNLTKDHPAYKEISGWSAESRMKQLEHQATIEASREHSESVEELILKLREVSQYSDRKARANFALYVYNKLI